MVTYCDIEGCKREGKCREFSIDGYIYYSDMCNEHMKEFNKRLKEYKKGIDNILSDYAFYTCIRED